LILSRHTELTADEKILVRQLKLDLPHGRRHENHRAEKDRSPPSQRPVAETFAMPTLILLTFRFFSPYVRPKWIALLPLTKPTTCETAYFGGIEIIMWA
jgi:hypothetical protein